MGPGKLTTFQELQQKILTRLGKIGQYFPPTFSLCHDANCFMTNIVRAREEEVS